MLIGTTDSSGSQEAKKPPISMIAFDTYRTALSVPAAVHANDRGCKHEKTARTQQAPKKGWIPAGMGSWSRSSANGHRDVSNGTSLLLAQVQHPRGSWLQSLGTSWKEPGGYRNISWGYCRNNYCQQLPRSLGWGMEAAFLIPSGNKVIHEKSIGMEKQGLRIRR